MILTGTPILILLFVNSKLELKSSQSRISTKAKRTESRDIFTGPTRTIGVQKNPAHHDALSLLTATGNSNENSNVISHRRTVISTLLGQAAILMLPQESWSRDPYNSDIKLRLESPNDRLGLSLSEVTIGNSNENTSRSVVAIKSIEPFGIAAKQQYLEVGMIVEGFPTGRSLKERMKSGPYPLELTFKNLAAGGDAIGDLGKTIVTAEDALKMAMEKNNLNDVGGSSSGFEIRSLKKPTSCSIRSRRGDVMEIQYRASYYNPLLKGAENVEYCVYDSSSQRGTGLPYQFILGSGDMLPGVDQGLYDMCPGEVRELDIPKELGYGEKGNKLFRVPGNVRLKWKVELVAVNSIAVGVDRYREDMD